MARNESSLFKMTPEPLNKLVSDLITSNQFISFARGQLMTHFFPVHMNAKHCFPLDKFPFVQHSG